MNAVARSEPSSDGTSEALQEAIDQLRRSADVSMSAALDAGIRLDDPLGAFIVAHHRSLLSMANTFEMFDHRVARAIQNTRDLSITSVHELKQATTQAWQYTESLKVTEAVLKLKADQAVSDFMHTIEPKLVEALRIVGLRRARDLNRISLWTRSALIAVALLAFGFGAYLYGQGDFLEKEPGRQALQGIQRCVEAARPDSGGDLWCRLKVIRGG